MDVLLWPGMNSQIQNTTTHPYLMVICAVTDWVKNKDTSTNICMRFISLHEGGVQSNDTEKSKTKT